MGEKSPESGGKDNNPAPGLKNARNCKTIPPMVKGQGNRGDPKKEWGGGWDQSSPMVAQGGTGITTSEASGVGEGKRESSHPPKHKLEPTPNLPGTPANGFPPNIQSQRRGQRGNTKPPEPSPQKNPKATKCPSGKN